MRDEIVRMFREGQTSGEIAAALGITRSAVSGHLTRAGVKRGDTGRAPSGKTAALTAAEMEPHREGYEAGRVTMRDIAAATGRGRNAVAAYRDRAGWKQPERPKIPPQFVERHQRARLDIRRVSANEDIAVIFSRYSDVPRYQACVCSLADGADPMTVSIETRVALREVMRLAGEVRNAKRGIV